MRFVLALLALLITGCAEAHPRDYALRLEFERGTCSGTAVGRNIVLTAEHCWMGGRLLRINGQDAYAMKIVKDGKDHALVRVTMQFDKWATLGEAPKQAQRVRWWGNPASQPDLYREGYILRTDADEVWIDAHAFGGDSGSGLYDQRGRVVAVLSGIKTWRTLTGLHFDVVIAYRLAFTREDWESVA